MGHDRTIRWAALLVLLAGCSTLPRFERASPEPVTDRRTPVAKALDYIIRTQWTARTVLRADRPWIGNWPQTVEMTGFPGRISEISVGPTVFIHHALSHVNERTVARLGLTQADADAARAARLLGTRFLRRFQDPPGPNRAAFGWWPRIRHKCTPARAFTGRIMSASVRGPNMHGDRFSASIPAMPSNLGILADADDTACIHMALLNEQQLDGGEGPPPGLGKLLARWRDDHRTRRFFPPWLPRESGAFATWFTKPGAATFDNDVDLIVLANCLWALAARGETDTPGYADSLRVLNEAIRAGRHRCHAQGTIYYTSPYALHGLVARAYTEGPVPELASAVRILADDVVARARHATWPGRSAATNAGFAISTLVAAGRSGSFVDAACRKLERLQDPRTGAWPDESIAFGHTERRQLTHWYSRAAVTGTCLTALIHAKLGPVLAR